eukprot:PLAT8548.1.p1 GENE.PLAT8548.1~~PLAT8548.1.p1  ORF type:complete len:189 (+),score=70.12 PLAT8548.1:25-591(+)
MGLFKDLMLRLGFAKTEVRIMVVGLDNSGKTTLINHLKPSKGGEHMTTTPTVGFSVEEFSKGSLAFTVFDMSGASGFRSLWEQYYCDISAIIFVVDSTDRVRMCVAKDELQELLAHADIGSRTVPLLLFANKMDEPSALAPEDVMDELDLAETVIDHPWHIQASNALTGEGVEEGIDWLAERLSGDHK